MTRRALLRFAPISALYLLLVVAGGCSSATATVSGKVTYKSKPVVWGTVSVIASDELQYGGLITSEGTYAIAGVPGGPARLLVSSPKPGTEAGARGNPAPRSRQVT